MYAALNAARSRISSALQVTDPSLCAHSISVGVRQNAPVSIWGEFQIDMRNLGLELGELGAAVKRV